MATYTVSGAFETGRGAQRFTRTVEAPNADVAQEHVVSQFGSEHGISRTQVEIDEITEETA